jgi:hypothetical protein
MFGALEFKSFSDFVPVINVPVEVNNLGNELTSKLEEIVLIEAPNIANLPVWVNDQGINPEIEQGLEDWLTNRAFEYNLLKYSDKYPELGILKEFIRNELVSYCNNTNNEVKPCYIQLWINILRPHGRFFTRHHHAHTGRIGDPSRVYVSGHICIKAIDTKTYYCSPFDDNQKIGIPNRPGDTILFPGWVQHDTDQNKSSEPRITLAFDIIQEDLWLEGQMDNPSNYIKLI